LSISLEFETEIIDYVLLGVVLVNDFCLGLHRFNYNSLTCDVFSWECEIMLRGT